MGQVDLLTTAEAAEILRTSPGSLRNARARGLGPPAIRLRGLGLRWRRRDIEAWIEQHEQQPATGGRGSRSHQQEPPR